MNPNINITSQSNINIEHVYENYKAINRLFFRLARSQYDQYSYLPNEISIKNII